MVTDALDHQGGTRVAHREPFAGLSPQEHLTRRGPVADRVPGDHLLRGIERRGAVGAYDDPPAREALADVVVGVALRSEEHTSELQSLMRLSYAVFCLKK